MRPDIATTSAGLLRERMIIRRTAEMLVSAQPPDVVFTRVCELLASQFGAHFVAIVETDTERPRVRWSFTAGEDSGIDAVEQIPADHIDGETASLHSTAHDRVVLFVPLHYGASTFGFLALGGGIRRFPPDTVGLIETCARYMAVAIYNVTLALEKERLEALATHDGLTSLYNRRAFDQRCQYEWRRAVRNREPLSLIMVDVDYFKVYNDAYGHVAGDHCLQQIAQCLMSSVSRPADMVARYGGEEFVALLPSTSEPGAIEIAERMCHKVADLHMVHRGSELDHVSICAGVATLIPNTEERHEALINAADEALYRAKEGGRNRVAASHYLGIARPARRRYEGRNNLPLQTTSFIGRDSEVAAIARALPTAQVISLLGPGGVGKTRLAIAAAQAALPTFPGGSWLIELGAERDGSRLPAIVAAALGVGGKNPIEELAASLTAAPALIVLDSCEHLLAACGSLVAQIVRRCPETRIITTSRQPLGLPGELRLRLDPLSADDAVALFLARVQDVRPNQPLAGSDSALVRAVCRRLDGLPLAVELAAMRLQNMSLQQLAEHDATLPQQTDLQDRIRGSFDLLVERERRFLARLSVLDGPFDEEAARATGGGTTFDALESFDLLTRLVEKSLVQVDLESGRYRLLGTIAEYVRSRLGEFDSPEEIRNAAAGHYASVVTTLHEDLKIGPPAEIFGRYEAVRENAEAALTWCLDGGDAETGAILASEMAPYWIETGRLGDARRYLESAIAKAALLSRRRLLDVLEAAVEVAAAGGDAQALEGFAERLRTETGSSSDGAETGRVMLALALTQSLRGNPEAAAPLYHHAANAFRIAGDSRSLARALIGCAEIAVEVQGDLAQAIASLNQALDAAQTSNSPSLVLDVAARLADRKAQSGEMTAAIELLRDVSAHFHELGDEASIAWVTFLLARHELSSEDPIVGWMHVRDALERMRAKPHPGRLAACFEALAQHAAENDEVENAVRLLAFAGSLRRIHGIAGSMRERRTIAALTESLEAWIDRSGYERAQREGRAMALEAAIGLALGEGRLLSGKHLCPA